jgi:hypothetical protein
MEHRSSLPKYAALASCLRLLLAPGNDMLAE